MRSNLTHSLILALLLIFANHAIAAPQSFERWKKGFIDKAIRKGLPSKFLKKQLAEVEKESGERLKGCIALESERDELKKEFNNAWEEITTLEKQLEAKNKEIEK